MNKKILTITLTILLVLPVLCFAGDVEIGEIKLRWKKAFGTTRFLLAQIPITNRTDVRCSVSGKFLFYDKDGFELRSIPFWKSVEAGEDKTLHVDGPVSRDDYRETATFKLFIKVSSFSWTMQGKPPLIIEKTLTLPPWE